MYLYLIVYHLSHATKNHSSICLSIIYGQFSSYMVVKFCIVAVNAELVNADPLLLGEMPGWVPCSPTHYYISCFNVCFCLRIPHLICIVDFLTLEFTGSSTITHAWMKLV